ncbi:hypothetical protein GCM10009535_39380 [Streptomyces thermocarboxydovorans]|uniref:Uncharacterized protein n=1 Tax=Streptomyces thermocarboxydovorans TaxID=59298 RepID=A0ABP3SVN5_9ACTN
MRPAPVMASVPHTETFRESSGTAFRAAAAGAEDARNANAENAQKGCTPTGLAGGGPYPSAMRWW